jgi:predicted nucleotidyltransferase
MATRSAELLQEFVQLARGAVGENLVSIVLYGSAARGEERHAYSDLNLLCVVKSAGRSDLDRLAAVVDWWSHGQKQRSPLVFTADELRRSADVFAIEMLDMKEARQVLYGEDIIADIAVPTNLHRVQVEHELRTMIQKLRQHYLHDRQDSATLQSVLVKSWSSAATLLRHCLIAMGEQAPARGEDLIGRVGKVLKVDASGLQAVLKLREGGNPAGSVAGIYGDYLSVLERVTEQIDACLPKPEWRRTGA